MKLLFLGKRSPMGRDLVSRPYGRFYYLPRLMAERGHEIYSLLLAYRKEPPVDFEERGVRWISVSLQPSPFGYLSRLRNLIEQVRPDWHCRKQNAMETHSKTPINI